MTREARSGMLALAVLVGLSSLWWWAILGMTPQVQIAGVVTVVVLLCIAIFPGGD